MATLNDLLVTGSARFVNTIQGNITTASVAAVANSVAWGNITGKPSSFSPSTHNHTYLSGWGDTRDATTAPNDYNSKLAVVGIKTPTASGTLDGSNYSTLMGIRGWNDSTGGNTHELAFTGNGALYHRHGATTSWNAWKRIPFGDGTGATGTWGINVTGSSASCTGNAATASILKGSTSSSAVPIAGLTAGYIKYFYNVNTGLAGNMPVSSNANGILQLNTHSGEYHHQLGFSSDGNIYRRSAMGTALTNSTEWWKLIDTHNYDSYCVTLTHTQDIYGTKRFNNDPEVHGDSYPSLFLVHNSTNSTGYRTSIRVEAAYNDVGSLWVNSKYGNDSSHRRGICCYGYANTSNVAEALKLRQCDTEGTWLDNLLIYHQGNIVYSADEPANPVEGMIWLQPVS